MDFLIELYSEASKTDIVIIGFILFIAVVNGLVKIPKWAKFKKQDCRPDSHDVCANNGDRLAELEKERLKGEQIGEIKYRATVYEQMVKVSAAGEAISMELRRNFNRMIDELGLSEKKRSDAKILYSVIIKWAIDDVKGYLRKWVKNNHFTEKDDVQFNEYIQDRIKDSNIILSMEIDKYYVESVFHVPRVDLKASNESVVLPKVSPMISKMFFEIRQIAEIKEKEIEEIRTA